MSELPRVASGIAGALQCLKASFRSSLWHRRSASVLGSATGFIVLYQNVKNIVLLTGKRH